MNLKEQTAAFLAEKRIAVVGVSRNSSTGTGNGILRALRDKGYEVFPVNPEATRLEGVACYPDVGSIPGGVGAVIIVTRPETAEAVMRDCVAYDIHHVWMHGNPMFGQATSSVSAAATEYGRRHGLNVIDGACPLMFVAGADFGHRCMRWLLGVSGKLPKADAVAA
ncbi:MAG: CoA-binding protein [Anaerolineales bacterium]|nr:CoA-binding protein [Anaerolineales bacterium]MCB0030956.1 CoA-binding protein [Anaerolineales bacterium]MCB8961138.1 CoA-binding protein [Ardenticatenales bacterium]